MVELTENLGRVAVPAGTVGVTLDYDQRSRTRQRVTLDDGREAAMLLPHGPGVEEGDVLRGTDGITAVVFRKAEEVITAGAGDWQLLARAAFHLGNRHAAVQVGELFLRFQPDPVLERMIESLGLTVTRESAAFAPEPGVGRHPHENNHGGHRHHRHSHGH